MRGEHRPEVVHPAEHGLVRNGDPALREQILDVTKAECEPQIEPNRLMDDLRQEPISGVADFPHTPAKAPTYIQQAAAGVTTSFRRMLWRVSQRDPPAGFILPCRPTL